MGKGMRKGGFLRIRVGRHNRRFQSATEETFCRKILQKGFAKKTQSAMEYLMTYGWAILIIAVVLTVLFSLGITNPLFFSPKAIAGGCQVLRPSGPGTTSFISLEGGGVCSEIPQYVSTFTSSQDSNVLIANTSQLKLGNELTVSVWVNIHSQTAEWQGIVDNGRYILNNWYILTLADKTSWYTIPPGYTGITIGVADGICCSEAYSPYFPINTWENIAFSYNAKAATNTIAYLNGAEYGSFSDGSPVISNSTIPIIIGAELTYPPTCNCSIANLQIYNTALGQNRIAALYREGIGGAPIDLQNLVGWWPLNGNANDYSGNNNDGIATNVIWSGTWWQDYTQP